MLTNSRDDNRRITGRLPQETLGSNFGVVLDLSAGGMRVLGRTVPRGRVEVHLIGSSRCLRVMGEVQWSKRRGLFKREVGFRFVDVDPSVAGLLAQLSLENRLRRNLAA